MFPGVIPFILIAAAVIARAVVSIRRDPRRPANALWLTGALIAVWMLVAVLSRGSDPLTGLVFFLALLAPLLVLVLIVVLIANGVVTWRREGRSLANLLSLLAGTGLAGVVALCIASVVLVRSLPWLVALALAVVFACAWIGFLLLAHLLYAWIYPHLWRRPRPDFVVVHGSGLVQGRVARLLGTRVEVGIARWRAADDERIPFVLSGGQGPDEPRSEASAMAEYAMRFGVPASAILLEDRSRTTRENLEFTRELVHERLGESARGVAVTSDYHVLRTAALARDVGLDVQVAPAHTALYFRISAFLREFVAMLARHRLANLVALAVVCLPLPLIMIWGLLLHG